MKKFWMFVGLAMAAALPALAFRIFHGHFTPLAGALIFGMALIGAGFLLSWGAEAAEEHVSQGLAMAVLALVTVMPEYAVDLYFTLQAGRHPGSMYVQYAAANMTGANRLLIGMAWPLIAFLYWWRSGKQAVPLRWENTPEVGFLAVASLYGFVITAKGRIDISDTIILVGIFTAYLWRVSKLPRDNDNDGEVGPAAALAEMPRRWQWAIMAALTVVAAIVILVVAEPFAESLVGVGGALGVNKFLLIQWIAPLAGEAPEIVIVVLFTLGRRPTAALGALVSDKINQWTLLVGTIPLFYSVAAGRVEALPLGPRQHEEFFLTAAQSLFAVSLLMRLRLSLVSGLTLLTLFLMQLSFAFAFRNDEARTIQVLTDMAWLYIFMAIVLLARNWRSLIEFARVGVLNQTTPAAAQPTGDDEVEG